MSKLLTPEKIAISNTEQAHQRAVFQWAAMNMEKYPQLRWLHHIPNGGSRGDSVQSRMIRGAAMKADGVKKGVPDLFLPVPVRDSDGNIIFCGLYIEMKKPGQKIKAGSEQEEFAIYCENVGYMFSECDHWKKAVSVIENYLSRKF